MSEQNFSGRIRATINDLDAPTKRAISAVSDALKNGTNGLGRPGTCAVLPRRIIFKRIAPMWDRAAVQTLADALAPVLAVHGVALDGPVFAPDGYGAAVGLYWVDVRAIGTRGVSPEFVATAGELASGYSGVARDLARMIAHDLTSDGYAYVLDAVREGFGKGLQSPVVSMWIDQYGDDIERDSGEDDEHSPETMFALYRMLPRDPVWIERDELRKYAIAAGWIDAAPES
jgi:hypothetical protein